MAKKRQLSEKELSNLTPFKKGNPGGGRPKGSISIVKIVERMLNQVIKVTDPFTGIKEKKKAVEAVSATLLAKAISGDIPAIKELLDRIDGKVTQPIGGNDGESDPIKHEIKLTVAEIDDRIASMLAKKGN